MGTWKRTLKGREQPVQNMTSMGTWEHMGMVAAWGTRGLRRGAGTKQMVIRATKTSGEATQFCGTAEHARGSRQPCCLINNSKPHLQDSTYIFSFKEH